MGQAAEEAVVEAVTGKQGEVEAVTGQQEYWFQEQAVEEAEVEAFTGKQEYGGQKQAAEEAVVEAVRGKQEVAGKDSYRNLMMESDAEEEGNKKVENEAESQTEGGYTVEPPGFTEQPAYRALGWHQANPTGEIIAEAVKGAHENRKKSEAKGDDEGEPDDYKYHRR